MSGTYNSGIISPGGSGSEVLRWVLQRGISNEECRIWYNAQTVQDPIICSQYYNNTSQSACQVSYDNTLLNIYFHILPVLVSLTFVALFLLTRQEH